MYIVEIEEIYIRYGRTYGRYIYTYKWKISIGITCVGLASARPNYVIKIIGIKFQVSPYASTSPPLCLLKANYTQRRFVTIKRTQLAYYVHPYICMGVLISLLYSSYSSYYKSVSIIMFLL